MQDLTANTLAQIAADASAPILLAEIYLDAGTLRYAALKSNLVFPTGGNTYTAKAFLIGNIVTTSNGQITEVEISFDNVLQDMHGFNVAETFDGKQIIIKKVYYGDLASDTYYREIFNGFMEDPHEIGKNWLKVRCVSGKALQRRILNWYYQSMCNHVFGDYWCNYNGYADLTTLKATGTADSGTGSTLVDNALTQADDFWKFGKIVITIDGTIYKRKVKSFTASSDTITFDVPLPVDISAGDAYTVYKGCPGTWWACNRLKEDMVTACAYGPSANNKVNFKGFIHIGDKE